MNNHSEKIVALLGPTNTGKTYVAIEKMLKFNSGIFGLPLRLLAREVYDKCVLKVGVEKVALITGEEKIIPSTADYFICTVESMPKDKVVEFIAIDEIQMCADRERGHIFTERLLESRGTKLTMFLGSQVMAKIIEELVEDVEFEKKERFSKLSYSGIKKISRLERKVAIIAFSIEEVYAIAELVRRQKGGAAVIMGSLSPKTRNSQVGLYQSGDVDYLIKYFGSDSIHIIDDYILNNNKVSSTLIKSYLSEGNIELANDSLGYKFSLSGNVIHGDQKGKLIGFPTANLEINDNLQIPKNGVYEVGIDLNGDEYKGIMNIGYKPTVSDEKKLSLEVHIFNFNNNIYNSYLTVYFKSFIRDEKKFNNIDELKQQITNDIEAINKN